jgi:hypothetical protein
MREVYELDGLIPEVGKEYASRRPMQYAGKPLHRGQIFKMVSARNNEALLRLGYMSNFDRKAERYTCAECGSEFVDMGCRDGHGKEMHRETPMDEREQERFEDAQERRINEVAPLYLDKTKAAAKGL